ncbi:hypothetical protein MRX96_029041 [Rhipicephalus microplus]
MDAQKKTARRNLVLLAHVCVSFATNGDHFFTVLLNAIADGCAERCEESEDGIRAKKTFDDSWNTRVELRCLPSCAVGVNTGDATPPCDDVIIRRQ